MQAIPKQDTLIIIIEHPEHCFIKFVLSEQLQKLPFLSLVMYMRLAINLRASAKNVLPTVTSGSIKSI